MSPSLWYTCICAFIWSQWQTALKMSCTPPRYQVMVCWLTTNQFKEKSDCNVIFLEKELQFIILVTQTSWKQNFLWIKWLPRWGIQPRLWGAELQQECWELTRGAMPDKFPSVSDWNGMLWKWCSEIWKVWVQFLAWLQISSRQIIHILLWLSSPSVKGR